ncbi:MAG: DUF3394 domain-containing protein, partial [Pseudomonadota bacterium]
QVQPPYVETPPEMVYEVVGSAPDNGVLTFVVSGPDFDSGETTSTTILVPMGRRADAIARLEEAGLTVILEDGLAKIDEPFPQTPFFETIGTLFDYYGDEPVRVETIRADAERLPKEIFYLPALLLLAGVYMLQRGRQRRETPASA